jgi:hypothetical protein
MHLMDNDAQDCKENNDTYDASRNDMSCVRFLSFPSIGGGYRFCGCGRYCGWDCVLVSVTKSRKVGWRFNKMTSSNESHTRGAYSIICSGRRVVLAGDL